VVCCASATGVNTTTVDVLNHPEASVWNLLADAFAAALRKIAFWALTRG